jgi:hypothetical protein
MNKNLKKILTISKVRDTVEARQRINTYLLNYHATSHDTTGESPSSLMFRFPFRTLLDIRAPNSQFKSIIQLRAEEKQQNRAKYADERRRPLHENRFQVGDLVTSRGNTNHRLLEKIGPFSFRLENGLVVNTRGLRLAKSVNTEEEIVLPQHSVLPTRPVRDRKPPKYLTEYVCENLSKKAGEM